MMEAGYQLKVVSLFSSLFYHNSLSCNRFPNQSPQKRLATHLPASLASLALLT